MKKLYEEFFYVPKHGKAREKVIFARIGASVALILICMVAMSVSAYAYFSCNIASGINRIQAAHYKLDVKAPGEMTPNTATGGYELAGGNTYEFTLTKSTEENIASVGFAEIQIADSADVSTVGKFYTKPIGTQLEGDVENQTEKKIDKCVVSITVPEGKTVLVSFISQWGTGATPIDCTLAGNTADGWYWTAAIDCSGLYPSDSSENPSTDTQNPDSGTDSSGTATDTVADTGTNSASSVSSISTDSQTQDSGTPVDTGTVTDSSTDGDPETFSDTEGSTDTAQTASTDTGTPVDTETLVDTGTATDSSEDSATESLPANTLSDASDRVGTE